MTNPFRKHANHLFASRGCDVDQALSYAFELVSAMPDEAKAAANTAIMVLVNTATNAFDQVLNAPSPERLALIELINDQITLRLRQEGSISDQIDEWFRDNLVIDHSINDWLSNNFDVTDYNFNDAVSDWMSDNFEDKINEMDLVVRVR
jgi:hypothetical protein